jgi:hypothetical protein
VDISILIKVSLDAAATGHAAGGAHPVVYFVAGVPIFWNFGGAAWTQG